MTAFYNIKIIRMINFQITAMNNNKIIKKIIKTKFLNKLITIYNIKNPE